MTSKHQQLKKAVEEALSNLFSDTSVERYETRESLEELAETIRGYIDASIGE